MRTVYKYPVPFGQCHIQLQGKILSVGMQADEIMIWAIHDSEQAERKVIVDVVGTGHPMLSVREDDFIGTVLDGSFVWHIFAKEGRSDC